MATDLQLAQHRLKAVKYYELQEVFHLRNGYTPSKRVPEYWEDGTIPWFRMEDIRCANGVLTAAKQHVTPAALKRRPVFPANSLLFSTLATIGEYALVAVPHLANQQLTSLAVKAEFAPRLDMKFAYYYCAKLAQLSKQRAATTSFPAVKMSEFRRFPFPIPDLAVQRRIVAILDTFTALQLQLQAELREREKQLAFYRKRLVNSGATTATVTIGELAAVSTGRRDRKDADEAGQYPFYVRSREVLRSNSYDYDETAIIIPGEGKVGEVFHYVTGKYALHQRAYRVAPKSEAVLPEFLYHYFVSNFGPFIGMHAVSAAVSSLRKPMIEKFPVKIPPLAQQRRAISHLRVFQEACDLTARELSARQKQYAYYRDQLLSFRNIGD